MRKILFLCYVLLTFMFIVITCLEFIKYLNFESNFIGLLYLIVNFVILFLLINMVLNFGKSNYKIRISKNLIVIVLGILFNRNDIALVALTVLSTFSFYTTFLSLIINTPIEKLIYKHFENMAKNKLSSMKNLKVIGITGSYGKTSCKNILNDILSIKFNTLSTPKSLNTFNGLMITINNQLDKFDDVFIAEMGAYVRGEINGLCDLVNPKYGIITSIGTAHLKTFGSEENIQKGKMELIEHLPSDGVGVLNRDDEKQANYNIKNSCKIIWIGIESKDVDFRAVNIKTKGIKTTFDIEIAKVLARATNSQGEKSEIHII